MSYILDALRKLEEKEDRPGGPENRLAGGNEPTGRPPRRKSGYILAAATIIAAVAIMLLMSSGDGDLSVEPLRPALQDDPGGPAGTQDPVVAAKTTDVNPIPIEAGPSKAATADTVNGEAEIQNPGSPSGTKPARPVATVEKVRQPPGKKTVEEVSFEEVFGDLGLEDATEPPSEIIAEDTRDIAAGGESRREKEGTTVVSVSPESPEPGRLYHFEELPAAVKGELGELDITGHIYSEDAGFRLLMIGDGVRREGDTISQGLILKEITGDGAHFTYREFLFFVEAF